MITLAFHFPAGRYHATPWGHQVNEGLVEWPPCPWRLVRALIATGYSKLGWGDVPPEGVSLIGKLFAFAPSFSLPATSMAHSRHYMPGDSGKTSLVLDTWLNVEGELLIHWPIDLDMNERQILTNLVESMSYLGRSESWVEGRLEAITEQVIKPNCYAHQASEPRDSKVEELVKLLIPVSEEEYGSWQTKKLPPSETGKVSKAQQKAREKLDAPYPQSVLASLQWDTAQWKSFGWSQPPGSQWCQYRRPVGCLNSASTLEKKQPRISEINVVLLSLSTPSGNTSALPTIARTMPQAELLHRSLVHQADPMNRGEVPSELSGCDENYAPLNGHAHTHILPMDLDCDGHLDHILLWSPMGLSDKALASIRRVRKTWTKGANDDLTVGLAGHGKLSELTNLPDGLVSHLGSSQEWNSATPFVPPRYLKKKGIHSLEGQIRAELACRGFPEPERVQYKQVPESGDIVESQRNQFRKVIRKRSRSGATPPQDMGVFVHLTFSKEVQGPLCLGYGSHFGLGLFKKA